MTSFIMGQSRGQRQQVKAQVTLRSEITNSLVLILMGVGSLSCEPYIIASFFGMLRSIAYRLKNLYLLFILPRQCHCFLLR